MNKNEFLKELKKHLSILEDGEQNDILEEYAQHIGMKISSGLSEEEAIRDFGNIKELAAQILEAYHVNPGYRKKRQEDIAEEGKKIWGSVKESARRIGRCIQKFCKAVYSKMKRGSARLRCFLKSSPVRNPIQKEKPVPVGNPRKISSSVPGKSRLFLNTAGRIIAGGFRVLWQGLLLCARLAWNLAVILIALMSGFCTLSLLFFLAVLLVWLTQGFPLAGLILICLGGVICFGALTILMATLILWKKRKTVDNSRQLVIKEVQHAYE